MAKLKDYQDTGLTGQLFGSGGDDSPLIDRDRRKRDERLKQLPINDIHPDAFQPRRVMPSSVRNYRGSMGDKLREWSGMVGIQADIVCGLITGEIEASEDYQPESAIEAAFMRIVALAGSIFRDGLTNPVTVVKSPDGYTLETGERRLIAFHLLNTFGFDGYGEIPARVVESFDVWRQATENNTRDDLNAIGKARQFAILLMDLLIANGMTFEPSDSFDNEQAYYAQVADGDTHRIPYKKAQMLVDAMGLKNSQQLRIFRAALRLDPRIWIEADDNNWNMNQLNMFMNSREKTVYTYTDSDNIQPSSEAVPPMVVTPDAIQQPKQESFWELAGVPNAVNRFKRISGWSAVQYNDPVLRSDARQELEDLRSLIDAMLDKLG